MFKLKCKKLALTSTLTAVLIAGLATVPSSFAKNIVIGAAMSSFADKGQTYLQDGIRKFAAENPNVTIKMTDANEDPSKMIADVDNFIDAGVDALLVVPTDPTAAKPIVRKAKKAGIPVIFANRVGDEETMKDVTSYAGSQSIQAGILQAEKVVKLLNGKEAKVLILMGILGQEAQIERTKGNKKVFAKYPNIQVVRELEGRWDRAKGMQIAEDILSAKQGVNVIVSNNDEMAIGALLAANKLGYKDEDLIITGVDATPDALDYLGKGLDFTIYQNMFEQGHTGAKLAMKAALKEPVKKYDWIKFEVVTPDLKDEYLAKYK